MGHHGTCTAFLGSLGSVRDFIERLEVPSLYLHRTGLGLEAEVPPEKGTRTLSSLPWSGGSRLRHTLLEGKEDLTWLRGVLALRDTSPAPAFLPQTFAVSKEGSHCCPQMPTVQGGLVQAWLHRCAAVCRSWEERNVACLEML